MAEIVILSGETRRIAAFLDTQLDPRTNPLVELLSERLPHDRWVVLRDLLHRKLAFFCMAWLAWEATIELADRLGVASATDAFTTDVPGEIHELVWAEIPTDILDRFDNSVSYRAFNERWGELIHEWARARGWNPLELPFQSLEDSEAVRELEMYLDERLRRRPQARAEPIGRGRRRTRRPCARVRGSRPLA